MNGHWAYIIPAYSVSLLSLAVLAFFIIRRARHLRAKLKNLEDQRKRPE